MPFALASPTGEDRVVKLRATVPTQGEVPSYVHGSGFIVREGVLLTSAHCLTNATSVSITDARGDTKEVALSEANAWVGDPRGPSRDRAPDLGLIREPTIGVGKDPFPVALLERTDPSTSVLDDVRVIGYPSFTALQVRSTFQTAGRVWLAGQRERGLIDIQLSITPRPTLDGSPWAGISGAPVIYAGHLIAIVTEHNLKAGGATLSALPLGLIGAQPQWPAWGPGVAAPTDWHKEIGLNPEMVAVLPGRAAGARWLRALVDLVQVSELAPNTPAVLSRPERYADQLLQAFVDALEITEDPTPERIVGQLGQALNEPAERHSKLRIGIDHQSPVRSTDVQKVLNEVWEINAFVARAAPHLLKNIEYSVRTPMILADLESEKASWATRLIEGGSPISAGAVEPLELVNSVEFEANVDAYGEVLALLSNRGMGGKDPVGLLPDLARLALRSDLSAPALPEWVRQRLSPSSERNPPFLTRKDVEPALLMLDEYGFVVNDQPTLAHLRQGFFAPTQQLDEAEDEFWQWYTALSRSAPAQHAGKLPMFWITGPSGSGKSIALLQLLSRLNRHAQVTAIKAEAIGDGIQGLATTIRALADRRIGIIGVDDPLITVYDSADAAWARTFASLADIRNRGDVGALPIFICCATTEQFYKFQSAHGQHVSMRSWELDPYQPSFVDALRAWYERRTGRSITVADAQPRLPAQLFFEWWKGEGTASFAARFHARVAALESPELLSFFNRLLAANRLYVGYPPEAVGRLTPQAQDALEVFRRDMHVQRSGASRPGYWLSHPHLANVIYEQWYPAERSTAVRAQHLREAVVESLGSRSGWGSVPFVERLLGGSVESAPVDGRLSEDQARDLLRSLSPDVLAASDALPLGVLAVWLRAERETGLTPDRAGLAAASCARLRECDPEDAGVPDLLQELVLTTEHDVDVWDFFLRHRVWEGWAHVAALLVGRATRKEHWEALLTSLRERPDAPGVQALLSRILAAGFRPDFAEFGLQVLAGSILLDEVPGDVAAQLSMLGPRYEAAAVDWLREEVRIENRLALELFLRRRLLPALVVDPLQQFVHTFPKQRLASAGLAKLLNWNRFSQRDFQADLRTYLQELPDSPGAELAATIGRMLETDSPAWSYLYTLLPESLLTDPQVVKLAASWLDRNHDVASWHRVFTVYAKSVSHLDEYMLSLGLLRVQENWDWPHCAPVLEALLSGAPLLRIDEIISLSLQWLRDHPNEADSWGYLAPVLLRVANNDQVPGVVECLWTWWVTAESESPAKSYVIRAILKASPSGNFGLLVKRTLSQWLMADRHGWAFVFFDFAELISPEEARVLVTPWLLACGSDPRWLAVFSSVIEILESDVVAKIASSWFRLLLPGGSLVGFMMHVVVEEGPCPKYLEDSASRDAVIEWLRHSGDSPSWYFMWRTTYLSDASDTELIEIGLGATVRTERRFGIANTIRQAAKEHPDLGASYWASLADIPRSETWHITCLSLGAEFPNSDFWELGLNVLLDAEPVRFDRWIRRLWKLFEDQPRREALQMIAQAWLQKHGGEPEAAHIRVKLFGEPTDGTDIPRDGPALVDAGAAANHVAGAPTARTGAASGKDHSSAVLVCFECRGVLWKLPSARGKHRAVCLRCAIVYAIVTSGPEIVPMRSLERRFLPAAALHATAGVDAGIIYCEQCHRRLNIRTSSGGVPYFYDGRCGALIAVMVDNSGSSDASVGHFRPGRVGR